MKTFLRKSAAFVKRDAIENLSYRSAFFFDASTVIFQCLIFFFIAKLIDPHMLTRNSPLAAYGGEYFPFVLIGIALASFQSAALTTASGAISREQSAGTLEAILITPTRLSTVVLSSTLWGLFIATVRVVLYLALGVFILKARFESIHVVSAILTVSLTVTSLAGFGLISAGFVLAFKRGNPVAFFFNGASKLLAGVYFPITVLPIWLKGFAFLLPLTYSIEAMRKACIHGAAPGLIAGELFALLAFTLVFLPLGIWIFSLSLTRAKKDGSLTFY